MKEHIRISLHYWFRAAIFLGFSLYILYLSKSGNLHYYIAPRMTVYVKLSAIAMYVIALYMMYSAIQAMLKKADACDACDHTPARSPFKNIAAYTLFVIPLLLGFGTPDTAMNSALADKKGIVLTGALTRSDESAAPVPAADATRDSGGFVSEAQLNKLFKSDKYTADYAKLAKKLYRSDSINVKEEGYIETLTAISLYKKPLSGKKIELSGFVYRRDDMTTDQFIVARFQMQCCSADATPFGIMVEYDLAPSMATDTWVKLSGAIGTMNYRGKDIVMIKADRTEKIAEPENVYVYPNYGFLEEL